MLDYLNEVTEGADQFYLCRRKVCRFFTLNVNWIENGGQFRCLPGSSSSNSNSSSSNSSSSNSNSSSSQVPSVRSEV